MASRQGLAAPPSAAQGMVEVVRCRELQVSTQRHSNGSGGARLEHGEFACCKYGLLAPEGLAGDPATAGPLDSGNDPQGDNGGRGHLRNGDKDKGMRQAVRAPRERPARGRRGVTP